MAKFSYNEIISLLDENLEFNLAESTAQDFRVGNLLTPEFLDRLKNLRLSYGTAQGNNELCAGIAENLEISAQSVLITNGAAAAIFLMILVLCDIGEEVVTVTPNFPPTLDIISAIGAKRRTVKLSFEGGYRLTPDSVADNLSSRTKLVILVSPHNPSGVAMSTEDVRSISDVVLARCPRAWVAIDETYREATYGNVAEIKTFASLQERVITTASFSKCHGAPGLRVGWLTCHSKKLMQQLMLAKMNTVISCSVVDELLALEVLRQRHTVLKTQQTLLADAVKLTAEWVSENISYVDWVRPDAGALCCIRLRPDVFNDAAVKEFYRQARLNQVQLASGHWFGEDKRVFRLGFGYLPLVRFKQALTKLSQTLQLNDNFR